uniref:HNH endonuclease n=1 Tax=Mycobacterium phage Pharb TaxID=3136626 RepID=A0AAU8GPK1_9VIRU
MARHHCSGDDCGYCERRIADAEYARDVPDDYPEFYDGT